jgi:hypothetical protein
MYGIRILTGMRLKKSNCLQGLLAAIILYIISFTPAVLAVGELVIGGSGSTPWSIRGIAPGDSGTQEITVTNNATEDGTLTIWVSNIVNSEGLNPESETGNTDEPGELGNYLTFEVAVTGIDTNITMPALIADLPQSATDTNYIHIAITAGATVTIDWNWNLPSGTGNIVQGDELSLDINYLLESITTTTTTTTTTSTTTTTTNTTRTRTTTRTSTTTHPTTTLSTPSTTIKTTTPTTITITSTPLTTVTITGTSTTTPVTFTTSPVTSTTTPITQTISTETFTSPTTSSTNPDGGGIDKNILWGVITAAFGLPLVGAIFYLLFKGGK